MIIVSTFTQHSAEANNYSIKLNEIKCIRESWYLYRYTKKYTYHSENNFLYVDKKKPTLKNLPDSKQLSNINTIVVFQIKYGNNKKIITKFERTQTQVTWCPTAIICNATLTFIQFCIMFIITGTRLPLNMNLMFNLQFTEKMWTNIWV